MRVPGKWTSIMRHPKRKMDKKWDRGSIILSTEVQHKVIEMYLLSTSPVRRKYACKLWTTFKQSTVFDAAATACTAHIILKTKSIEKLHPFIIKSKLYLMSVSD
jgi:hypothetical protein